MAYEVKNHTYVHSAIVMSHKNSLFMLTNQKWLNYIQNLKTTISNIQLSHDPVYLLNLRTKVIRLSILTFNNFFLHVPGKYC